VNFDGLLVDQFKNNKLIVANLHDSGNGFVRVFGGQRIGVVHFKKSSGDAIRAKGGTLIHIHKHNIDVNHNTHSHQTQLTPITLALTSRH
jgi:hypothetical protein